MVAHAPQNDKFGSIARPGRMPGTRTACVRRTHIANIGGWESRGKGGFVKSPSRWRNVSKLTHPSTRKKEMWGDVFMEKI
jgi:hypothetical protein